MESTINQRRLTHPDRARVQELPVRDCLISSNNLVPRNSKVSTIDVITVFGKHCEYNAQNAHI